MTDYNQLMFDYPSIEFIPLPTPADLTELAQVDTIAEVMQNTTEIEYLWEMLDSDKATDTVLKIILATCIQCLSKELVLLWAKLEEAGNAIETVDKQSQLIAVKEIADQLYLSDSSEATALREACKTTYFNRIYLVNRNIGQYYFAEESDKTELDFKKMIDFASDTITKLIKELIMDEDEGLAVS